MSDQAQSWWDAVAQETTPADGQFGLEWTIKAVKDSATKAVSHMQSRRLNQVADRMESSANATEVDPKDVRQEAHRHYTALNGPPFESPMETPKAPSYNRLEAEIAMIKLLSRFFAVLVAAAKEQLHDSEGVTVRRRDSADEILEALTSASAQSHVIESLRVVGMAVYDAAKGRVKEMQGRDEHDIGDIRRYDAVKAMVSEVIQQVVELEEKLYYGTKATAEKPAYYPAVPQVQDAVERSLQALRALEMQSPNEWLEWDEDDETSVVGEEMEERGTVLEQEENPNNPEELVDYSNDVEDMAMHGSAEDIEVREEHPQTYARAAGQLPFRQA